MGKRTKVTLDTNTLVSALGWLKGNPHKILQKAIDGEIDLFVSHEQFEEMSRVLEYPKLRFTEEQKARLKSLLSERATFVKTTSTLDMVKDDPSDNRILECAQAAEVDFLVSGDEHLLALGRLGRTRIVSASDFLKAS